MDTLRADRVGALSTGPAAAGGGSATPRLDAWAGGAAAFRRASSPAPFTMPAMAALLSGQWPDRCGVVAHEPGVSFSSWKGDTLAEAAARAGLATGAVIANPWLARTGTGFDRGFSDFLRLYQPEGDGAASGAGAVTDAALRLLEGYGERRFLLWAHYFDPHMPYSPPRDFAEAAGAGSEPSRVMTDFDAKHRDLAAIYRGEGYSAEEIERARRLYDAEVRYADREIGRLLDGLEKLGRADDTIVVVASDHGESLGEHGLFFAHDFTLYEELLHVALLLRGPGVAAGARDKEVSLVDVTPTLCRLAGLDCGTRFDGEDLFVAATATPRTLFAASTPERARMAPFARLQMPGLAGRWTMAQRGRTKLLRIPTKQGVVYEMYDLDADPRELHEILARRRPFEREGPAPEGPLRDLVRDAKAAQVRLDRELDTWMAEMDRVRPEAARKVGGRRADRKTLRSLGYLQ